MTANKLLELFLERAEREELVAMIRAQEKELIAWREFAGTMRDLFGDTDAPLGQRADKLVERVE